MIFTLDPIRRFVSKYSRSFSIICGILSALTQPPTFYIFGLIGFSGLFYLIYSASNLRDALSRNFLFSLGYYGYGFYWSVIAISVYMEDFWWAIPIAFFGLPLIFICFTSLITILAWKYRFHNYYVMIYTILWTFIEWLTSFIFTGLPWMLVGHVAGFSDIVSQFASIASIYGLSFVMLNLAGTFYYIFGPKKSLQKSDIIYVIIIIAIIFGYGSWRLAKYPMTFTETRIRIVQPSIKQGEKWSESSFWDHMKKHKFMSRAITHKKPDIILWSEAAVMAPYQMRQVRNFLNIVAKENKAILLTGIVSLREGEIYSSMVGISPVSKLLFEYNKNHLVPFGEYIPFRNYLPIKKLTHGFQDYSFGTGPEIFEVAGYKIRPLICYESIFPQEVKTDKADLFVNITNSSWYGDSSAPHHLFYVNKFRAIENSTPVVISANSGISGAFDSLGREIAKTNLNDLTVLDTALPQKIHAFSPYSLLGLSVILLVVTLLQILRFITKNFL